MGQGYVFTHVCDSVHGGGRCLVWEGLLPGGSGLGGCLVQGCAWSRGGGGDPPPMMATAAGGTYPTGMHSCVIFRITFRT